MGRVSRVGWKRDDDSCNKEDWEENTLAQTNLLVTYISYIHTIIGLLNMSRGGKTPKNWKRCPLLLSPIAAVWAIPCLRPSPKIGKHCRKCCAKKGSKRLLYILYLWHGQAGWALYLPYRLLLPQSRYRILCALTRLLAKNQPVCLWYESYRLL